MNQWDRECIRRYQKVITECKMKKSDLQREISKLDADIAKYEKLIKEIENEPCS